MDAQDLKARHLYREDADSLRHRQADEMDFRDIYRLLTAEQRAWLEWAIGLLHPEHSFPYPTRRAGCLSCCTCVPVLP
jgi:hypothetical protein